MALNMIKTPCLFCGAGAEEELFPQRLPEQKLDSSLFSARRRPDKIHYRIVKCQRCGLVWSNPILEEESLQEWYRKSHFNYPCEARDAALSYLDILKKSLELTNSGKIERMKLLEIGCGNGIFLELSRQMGFTVRGVEPSAEAVKSAPASVRSAITNDCFDEGMFKEEEFHWICCFHVIDHLARPDRFLEGCHRLLVPGAHALFACHNVDAFSSRLLRERSPIIDIEHVYLFSARTLKRLFEKAGFTVVCSQALKNKYSLEYWLKIAPLPEPLWTAFSRLVKVSGLARARIGLYAGNQWILAEKPH
jgi:2-polyprenyl-3-methyl-5-hydroxy-6-metoxy-1,4-benzoquinol methylase